MKKLIVTSWRALFHRTKADKFAQKCYFVTMDYFGLVLSKMKDDTPQPKSRNYHRKKVWTGICKRL